MAASLCLVVAGALGLGAAEEATPLRERELRARGWQGVDGVSCAPLRPGAFYELAGESGTAEALALPGGGALASRLPLPEAYSCREIPGPQFVEEIP